ncbi:MAG: ATP synthase F1 subunit epsilon [Taibaiella sp.]|jgi:F-type H+-transporting ATPase subunit epsilon|nr:ATP synthase F1 subunit epsilon [Taibaiella sp.]
MNLEILTPEHKVFSGKVYGIQLPGTFGSFELLENHAPMIASLGKGKMKVIKDKNLSNNETYEITGGFVEVINNNVSVLIEDATALG